ncbi:hypothetical protein MCHLDSM_03026 [Mycolicibacterium chlorophenolicum]|uniref:Uncharacterized protein n=1 Tax=Mycolicibacterium chlorophenolicum TaxID=37916 RepID=A0A0J6W5I8_9MYCO|nr:hypothetical protein MCHLDSM_03026 [Mycolicibacterium chlorophenolicum]
MRKRVLVSTLLFLVAVIIGLTMALVWSPEPRDYLTLGVGTIALLALVQTTMSSTAATINTELNKVAEDRKKYGWSIVLHPDGGSYVLRNTGTVTAKDVKLVVPGERARAAFLQHEGEVGPTIPYNQSKGFRADFPWTSRGTEIQIDWLPDGEAKRRTHNDVVQPTPDRIAEYESRQRQKLDDQRANEDAQIERYAAECRRLLIELATAWGEYCEDPTERKKMRVQALVGALPTNFVREIGYQVDVTRDYWGIDQWPPEVWTPDSTDDQELLRRNAAMIELAWNLRQVQIPKFVEIDLSQSPEHWYRINHAVYGFRDQVRGRESGEREFRDGQRDREQRLRTRRELQEFNKRWEESKAARQETASGDEGSKEASGS